MPKLWRVVGESTPDGITQAQQNKKGLWEKQGGVKSKARNFAGPGNFGR